MRTSMRSILAATALLLALVGCNKSEPAAATAETEAPAAESETPTPEPAAKPEAPTAEVPAIPDGAAVSFGTPSDGQTIKGSLTDGKVQVPVKMVATGIEVKPAGAPEAGSGHHHILIDAEPLAKGTVVPADETHIHFGKGQTETELSLSPGEHSLTLQFADGLHRSYGPELASTIKVTVEAE